MTSFNLRQKNGKVSQATVEFALMIPILLLLFSVVVDWSRYVARKQEVVTLAREASSLAARQLDSASSTNFPVTMNSVVSNSAPLNCTNDACIYIGRVFIEGWQPILQQYSVFSSGYSSPKKVLTFAGGFTGSNVVTQLPTSLLQHSNQTFYITEFNARFTPAMPLSRLIFNGKLTNIHETAYF